MDALRVGLLICVTGCAGHMSGAAATDAGSTAASFVAINGDFTGYHDWSSFELDGGGQYPRIIYISARPPHGATSFPVGTLIVKELLDPLAPGGVGVDAMVKRGGGFNPTGAPGWEFFELSAPDAGPVSILWRGTGISVPTGTYVGGGTSCVGCHAVAQDNDYVQSGPLQLDASP